MFTESLLCDPPAREAPAGPHQSLVQRLCPGVPQQGHPARLPPGPGDSGQSGAAKGRTGEGPAGHSHKDWRAGPGLPRVGDDLQARAQGPVPRARAGRHPHSTQAPAGPTGDVLMTQASEPGQIKKLMFPRPLTFGLTLLLSAFLGRGFVFSKGSPVSFAHFQGVTYRGNFYETVWRWTPAPPGARQLVGDAPAPTGPRGRCCRLWDPQYVPGATLSKCREHLHTRLSACGSPVLLLGSPAGGQGTGGPPHTCTVIHQPQAEVCTSGLGFGPHADTFLFAKSRGRLPLQLSLQEGKST